MSDAFHMDMPQLPGFVAAMRALPKTMDNEMLVAGKRIAFRGRQLATVYVKRDTGNLAASIYGDARLASGGVVAEFGASADYALPVDKGRRPGGKMPPQGALLPWMAAHGIPESSEFVVRRAIARRGIAPHPFVSRAYDEMKSSGFIVQEFKLAITRTLATVRFGGAG